MNQITTKKSTHDGLSLQCYKWEVDSPKAIIGIVHGLGEHGARYDSVAKYLNGLGLTVWAFDHRGHGKSEGKRGHTPDYDAFMKDVDGFISEIQTTYPKIPFFLYGHSMGGNLVSNYIQRFKPALTGAVITSPWIKNAFNPPVVKEVLGKMMNNIWPSLALPTGLDTKAISRDPAAVKLYEQDPLVHSMISSRLYNSLMEAGEWLLENAEPPAFPMLLLHGNADAITSHKATIQLSEKLGPKTDLRIWEGGFHELHNDPDKDEVLLMIGEWLIDKL